MNEQIDNKGKTARDRISHKIIVPVSLLKRCLHIMNNKKNISAKPINNPVIFNKYGLVDVA